MTGYMILKPEQLPESLKNILSHLDRYSEAVTEPNLFFCTFFVFTLFRHILFIKPRWMICVVFTAGLLIMTLSAIAAGIFIGYTYCYVEHRTGFRASNMSQTQDLRIFNVPLGNTEDTTNKKTINEALLSSQLVQRILKIGHTLWDKDETDHVYLPGPMDEKNLSELEQEA